MGCEGRLFAFGHVRIFARFGAPKPRGAVEIEISESRVWRTLNAPSRYTAESSYVAKTLADDVDSYGDFNGRDLLRNGVALTIVESVILLLPAPLYWP